MTRRKARTRLSTAATRSVTDFTPDELRNLKMVQLIFGADCPRCEAVTRLAHDACSVCSHKPVKE